MITTVTDRPNYLRYVTREKQCTTQSKRRGVIERITGSEGDTRKRGNRVGVTDGDCRRDVEKGRERERRERERERARQSVRVREMRDRGRESETKREDG